MRTTWVGKRKSERLACLLRAELRMEENAQTVPCEITNISSTGARIHTADCAHLPDEFDVFIPSRRETRFARVCWRQDDCVGVEFMAARLRDDPSLKLVTARIAAIEARLNTALAPAPEVGDMHDRIVRLEAGNAELMAALKTIVSMLQRSGVAA